MLSFFPRTAHSALAGLHPHTVPYLLFTGHWSPVDPPPMLYLPASRVMFLLLLYVSWNKLSLMFDGSVMVGGFQRR